MQIYVNNKRNQNIEHLKIIKIEILNISVKTFSYVILNPLFIYSLLFHDMGDHGSPDSFRCCSQKLFCDPTLW